ncbi:MAG: transcriptional regulator [Acetobacteraceae bacterium]|nr:transcriptional regulator [Acetobacteraceae bacterium]MDW8398401.1 transcriptional regulator [Acetobacteraceae bacterium]
MLERHDCPWCRRWLREVGEAAWNNSDLGRRAPLRRVDVGRGLPEDLAGLRNWRFTPTFVLMAEGREVGRITGYQSDWFFWQQAEALLARLPPTPPREDTR